MMKWVFTILVGISIISGILTGNLEQVSNAAIDAGGQAVKMTLELMGMMCLWSGVMKVAQKSGLTRKLAGCFSPLFRVLFPKLEAKSEAAQAISLNLTANLMGLGNAVTPLGIAAMRSLEERGNTPGSATQEMVMLTVLNTASMQLLPTTIAALRLAGGSAHPLEILPAVWLSSLCSVCAGVLMVKALAPRAASAKHIPKQRVRERGVTAG